MTKLKLFIWSEFLPDYSDGLAFAIAETEEEAREMVIEDIGLEHLRDEESKGRFGILEVKSLSEKCVYSSAGGS